MSVCWHPRGLDCRPGRHLVYVFENEVTRRKGLPRDVVPVEVTSVWYGMAALRQTTTSPTGGGCPVFAAPVTSLRDPADVDRDPYPWTGGIRPRPRLRDWEAETAARRRLLDAAPVNPDLLDRARARWGDNPFMWPSRRALHARIRAEIVSPREAAAAEAAALGHDLYDNGRYGWTCSRCLRHAQYANGVAYGSALAKRCGQSW